MSLRSVRKVDIAAPQARYKGESRTKHLLAMELCREAICMMRGLGSKATFVVVFG